MPVSAEALTTVDQAKRVLGIASATNTNNALIEMLIDAATQWIQDQCNRKFGRRDYNDGTEQHAVTGIGDESKYLFSGDGKSSVLILPNYPVDSASFTLEELVSRDSTGAGSHTWTSSGYVTGYDYVVEWDKGIVRLLSGSFSAGTLNYRVTYEAGYEEPKAPGTPAPPWVPADLQRCCDEVVKMMYEKSGGRVSSESIGTWSRSFDLSKDNPMVEMVIGKYKAFSNLY